MNCKFWKLSPCQWHHFHFKCEYCENCRLMSNSYQLSRENKVSWCKPEYFLVPTSSVNTSNQTRHAWSGYLIEDQGASSNGNNYIKQEVNPLIKELTEMQAIQGTVTLRIVISDRMNEEPSRAASGQVVIDSLAPPTPFLMVTPQWSWLWRWQRGILRGVVMRVFPVLLKVG